VRVPAATYRLQLHARFRLEGARRLLPYLDTLGISHLYLSPILQARAGSTHGYDVTDPTRIDPEIGEPPPAGGGPGRRGATRRRGRTGPRTGRCHAGRLAAGLARRAHQAPRHHSALRFRREHAELFARGEYLPLQVRGTHAESALAFARRFGDHWCLALVPRLSTRVVPPGTVPLGAVWGDTAVALPPGTPRSLCDVLSGRSVVAAGDALRLADSFALLPVARLQATA
jgi:maltooligosyltrehalose synthase